jgi:hypothetical protein
MSSSLRGKSKKERRDTKCVASLHFGTSVVSEASSLMANIEESHSDELKCDCESDGLLLSFMSLGLRQGCAIVPYCTYIDIGESFIDKLVR